MSLFFNQVCTKSFMSCSSFGRFPVNELSTTLWQQCVANTWIIWKMKEEKKALSSPPFLHLLQYGTVAGNEVLQFYMSRSVLCGFLVFFFFLKLWSVSFQSSLQQSGSNQLKAWKRHYVIAKDKKASQCWGLVAEASLWPHPSQDLWRTLCSSGPSRKIASARFQQTIPAFPSPASGLWVFWSLSHVWAGIH